jgi:hypothetical protein
MEKIMSDFLEIDWTSPTFLPICIALCAGVLAKFGVINSRNYKVICIAIALMVGIGYAIQLECDSALSIDREIARHFVYGLATSAMSWMWLYLSVYGQFRQEGTARQTQSDPPQPKS